MSIDTNDPRASALERLASTRARMRVSLQEAADPRPAGGDQPSVLMTALMAIPGVHVVVDAVRNWWSHHPLHLATMVASNTARGMVRPMARRNPYGLVLAAMAVGGLLYWVKPWRGLLKPALLAGLVPHLVSRAMAHVPMESWFSALTSMASQRSGGAASHAPDKTAAAAATAPMPTSAPATAATTAATDSRAQPVAPQQAEPAHVEKPAGPLH